MPSQSPYDAFYEQLLKTAWDAYPTSRNFFKTPQDLHSVLSPHVVVLPQGVMTTARAVVDAFWHLSRTEHYQAQLPTAQKDWLSLRNSSVLMAYDFHIDAQGQMRLIEINTNASGYFLSSLLALQNSGVDPRPSLVQSFESEWQAVFGTTPCAAITVADQGLATQKMAVEFYMATDLFQQHGWAAQVQEWGDLAPPSFVYNRHTDFYLTQPESQKIRQAALRGDMCLTPSPKEYLLLADKLRLVELSKTATTSCPPEVAAVLLKTERLQAMTPEVAWSRRKEFFFKPQQSYGGKSVYRGSSVTKKVFSRVYAEDSLIQEFFAPGVFIDDQAAEWKFDLRFYVYRNQIQQQVARLYKGQTTNFQTAFGGFAKIRFE